MQSTIAGQRVIASRNFDDIDGTSKFKHRAFVQNSLYIKAATLVLINVEFKKTSGDPILDYDNGFGCAVAAIGDITDAVSADHVTKLEKVTFEYDQFVLQDRSVLERTSLLVCRKDGTMLAVRG